MTQLSCIRCCCGNTPGETDTHVVHAESIFTDQDSGDAELGSPQEVTGKHEKGASAKSKLYTAQSPPTEPLVSGDEFLVRLEITAGTSIGVGVTMADSDRTVLKVASVQRDGAVHQWNETHKLMQIELGDTIRQINNVRGNVHALLRECAKGSSFDLKIRKR
eukprot:CAMPEP_0194523670 /NCGR_PEP_ID=MMETSP0253-20130528/58621_1 /TAXON_ID=2966 /ORGANISM="Noctiluca scintillans" /LENGTH=161 /DNA_ID=CAMNT_0039368231 /DNA_START=3 /DNA_END=488 /DNA_ORIENTATION=+